MSVGCLRHVARRRVSVRHKAAAATGFIHAARAHCDALFRFESALRVVGWLAAAHADGVRLRYVFGDCKKLRHWLERFSGVVLIQPRYDNSYASTSEFVHGGDEFLVEELP